MDTDDLLFGHGHEPQRVSASKVLFFGKRQGVKVIGAVNAGDAGFLESVAVKVVALNQTLDLVVYLPQLRFIDFHGIGFFLPVHRRFDVELAKGASSAGVIERTIIKCMDFFRHFLVDCLTQIVHAKTQLTAAGRSTKKNHIENFG